MVTDYQSGKSSPHSVMWQRQELAAILNVYGHLVAQGEWKDYAIDALKDCAVFSIFRRASEVPLYTIVKTPSENRKQGQYKIVAAGGMILKRGHELIAVLRVFDRKRFRVVD